MTESTGVILVGHGSRLPQARLTLPELSEQLSKIRNAPVAYAYLQFAEPTIADEVARIVGGKSRIALVPVFISTGQHVNSDLPRIIETLTREYGGVSFELSEPVGADPRLVEILHGRLESLLGDGLEGPEIAQKSFMMIDASTELPQDPSEMAIASRIVHSAGDRTLGRALQFSPGAIAAGIKSIRAGGTVLTDVAMVKSGISRRLLSGNKVVAGIDLIAQSQPLNGGTRAAAGIRAAVPEDPALIVVGNAPTALEEVCRLIEAGKIQPGLVVGVPVGFVGAAESKETLMRGDCEYIALPGTRGGSPIAAAIVNALSTLANESERR